MGSRLGGPRFVPTPGLTASLKSKVVYKASCWDCKTKRRLHDRKPEHFKALMKSCQASAIADYIQQDTISNGTILKF